MATLTETWSEAVVTPPYNLLRGNNLHVNFDLRTKLEANVQVAVGFGGTTSLTTGVDVRVYRTLNNDVASYVQYGAPVISLRSDTTAGMGLINGALAAGVATVPYDSVSGRTFVYGDRLCLWGATAIPVTAGTITNPTVEFINTGKIATPFVLDSPTKYVHGDNEYVANANTWNFWLRGGSAYSVVFDYLDDAAGEQVVVAANMQTHDTDVVA